MSFLLIVGCALVDDRVEEYHDTYEDLVKSRTTGRYSWKLAYLPEDANNIHSITDLDTGEVWVRYDYSGSSSPKVRSDCIRVYIAPNLRS